MQYGNYVKNKYKYESSGVYNWRYLILHAFKSHTFVLNRAVLKRRKA